METLVLIALWAGMVFLMMWLGCGAHGHGHRHGAAEGEQPPGQHFHTPERDTDPVCGKAERAAFARTSVHDAKLYHFCSRDCREIFEAAPELCHGERREVARTMEDSHA